MLLTPHRYLATLLTLMLPFAAFGDDVAYRVEFAGDLDRKTRIALYDNSQLVSLEDRPPASLTSLKRRAHADIPHLMQALHSLAHFNAEIDVEVDEETSPVTVRVNVKPGPVFTLEAFHILPAVKSSEDSCSATPEDACIAEGKRFLERDFLSPDSDSDKVEFIEDEPKTCDFDFDVIDLESIGICLGAPALPLDILEAEDTLLAWVNEQGYPLAQIKKREVVADQEALTVTVWLYVDPGPLAYLAVPTISGNCRVCDLYIRRKIGWWPGELYSPDSITCTFNALECSGLFRSINVELGSELNEDGLLPVDIIVSECRQRSIGAGLNYSTEFGAGFVGEWQHRNVRGMGETVTFKTEVLRKLQNGTLTYRIPDFLCSGMDLLSGVEIEREITDSFRETLWEGSTRLHRRFTCNLQGWLGLALKYTYSTKTDNDRHFILVELPMQLRHSTVDDVLDPGFGHAINLKFTPAHRLFAPSLNYYTTTIDTAYYIPLPAVPWITLAGKLSLASIVGAGRRAIPPPERCYAGTPSTLRGYPYLSVAPLDAQGRPEGGRSLMVTSFEARCRLSEDWGAVAFWEIGNVYVSKLPQITASQMQSTGLGLRYYTPVGPLRLDFAIPLNRRPGIDPPLQVYFSIGQTY